MKNLIILIPGNPSVPGLYRPFLDELILKLNLDGETKSEILPHLGQCNSEPTRYKKISLEDVLNKHRARIMGLRDEYRPDKTVLIGHSLGGAMLISLYQDFESIADKFIFLCPFVGLNTKISRYLKMFKNPITRIGMKTFSKGVLINRSISNRFFTNWLGENNLNEIIIREIKKPNYIDHFFALVSEYYDTFEDLNTKGKLTRVNPAKSFFVFAGNDFWVPKETVDLLPQSTAFIFDPDLVHDFCLDTKQSAKLSRAIADNYKSKKMIGVERSL